MAVRGSLRNNSSARPIGAHGSPAAPAIPRGAVDSHVHVFDALRFPFDSASPYTPQPHEAGTVGDLTRLLDAHAFQRVVIVNPTSGYGLDTRCLYDALSQLGSRARGITRVPIDIDRRKLRALAVRRVIGVRLDVVAEGLTSVAGKLEPLLRRLADEGMVLDIQCEGDQLAALLPELTRVPVRIVVDHIGRPVPARGLQQPGFAALLALADTGRAAVKLSGAMRCSQQPPPWGDVDVYVAALAARYGRDRLMFGSDWPFLRSPCRADFAPLLVQLARWFPVAADRRRILVDTPAAWFGFEE